MKNQNFPILLIIAFIIIGSFIFHSCKKGKDDPFISLRSRKERLCGEWDLSAGNITKINGSSIDSTVYNGGSYIENLDGIIFHGSYTDKIIIDKNGSFSEVISQDSTIESMQGSWTFERKDKDQKLKSKEAVMFFINSDTYTSNGNSTVATYSGTNSLSVLRKLDMLKNTEMTIIFNGITYNGNTSITRGQMTYKKK
jgi:hypothetical protein